MRPKYTKEEVETLEMYWGKISRAELMKKLEKVNGNKRTWEGICKKVSKLNKAAGEKLYPAYGIFDGYAKKYIKENGCTRTTKTIMIELRKSRRYYTYRSVRQAVRKYSENEDEYLTCKELQEVTGATDSAVSYWIRKMGLPCYRAKQIFIVPEKFFKWVKTAGINLRNYKLGSLPNEPKWLYERIEKDKAKKPTKNLIEQIITLHNIGCTQKEIMRKCGLDQKRLKNVLYYYIYKNKDTWKRYNARTQITFTQQEIDEMMTLYEQGETYTAIARQYSRHKVTVRNKILAEIKKRKEQERTNDEMQQK